MFAQMVSKMGLLTSECLLLPHRVWKVKFVGESVDDCGGGYSESIAEMCDELTAAGETKLFFATTKRAQCSATINAGNAMKIFTSDINGYRWDALFLRQSVYFAREL